MTLTRSATGYLVAAVATSLAAIALVPALGSPTNAPTDLSTTSSTQQHAQGDHRIVHHDSRHDVVEMDYPSETTKPAPHERASDITTTVVDHRHRRLVIHTELAGLRRSGYRMMVAEILTPHGRRFTLIVDYSAVPIDSRLRLERFASGRKVSCAGASWSLDGPAHRVDASLPASCLGDPSWVRVGVAVSAATHDLDTSWADDSRARGRIGDRHLRLGPRQHAG